MTVKPETKFGNEITKNIDAFWQPFTITATAGIPDLYGIKGGVSIWLELKCINKNSINISPLQISWNYNHFQENGKNYFLVKHTEQRIIKLYDGDKGKELKCDGFRVPCIVELEPPYDWQGLGDQLFDGDSILHNG
jgi:hypothetical protein